MVLQSKIQILESSTECEFECELKIIWDYSCIKWNDSPDQTERMKVYEEYRTNQGFYRFITFLHPSRGLKESKNSVFKKAFDKDKLFIKELSNNHKSPHHAFKALRESIIDLLFEQYNNKLFQNRQVL